MSFLSGLDSSCGIGDLIANSVLWSSLRKTPRFGDRKFQRCPAQDQPDRVFPDPDRRS